jgi:sec-independent protein translocase protein TatC
MDNNFPLKPSDLDQLKRKFSPFLVEVKKRILVTLGVFVVSMFVGFALYEKMIRFLINLLSLNGVNIVFTSPFQFINLAISCGVVTGIIITGPLFVYQILSFLKPALKKREYRMVIGFLPFCLFLFLVGFSFGAIIMKWQIEIFLARSVSLGIGNVLDISNLLSVVLITSGLMGIGFQFPIILLLLMRIGVLKHQQLNKARPWVYLGSFLFAILLPPDSILADIVLSLPLIILFELTLIINRVFEKSRQGRALLEGV